MAPRSVLAAAIAAFAVALAPLPARPAEEPSSPVPAPEPERRPVRAELVIEADLGEASAIVIDRARARGESLLRTREVLPARGAADPQIRIRIEPIGSEPGFRCHFGAYRGEEVIEHSDGVSMCKLCTDAELIDHVEAAIDRVVPKLPSEPAAKPASTPTSATSRAQRAPLSPLGKAGIGVAVTGVVAAIAGAVVSSRPTQTSDMGLTREQTEFRVPGIAVLSVGVAVMIAGLAMIAVDRHRAKRRGSTARRVPAMLRF